MECIVDFAEKYLRLDKIQVHLSLVKILYEEFSLRVHSSRETVNMTTVRLLSQVLKSIITGINERTLSKSPLTKGESIGVEQIESIILGHTTKNMWVSSLKILDSMSRSVPNDNSITEALIDASFVCYCYQ